MHLQVTICVGLTHSKIGLGHLPRLSIEQRRLLGLILQPFSLFLLEGVLVIAVEFVCERDLEDVHGELILAI